MKTQDLIEVRKGSTYTFTHFIEYQNEPIIPTTATIIITDSAGNSILASTAMTINATTGICTYAWDSTGYDVGVNYLVTYSLNDQEPVLRIFDIMLYPFVNNVTDDDLFSEYRGLKDNNYEVSSKSQSGTVNTLVDINRSEKTDHWDGGIIQVFQAGNTLKRDITSYDLTTSTVGFSPDLPEAITTESYIMRQSYQEAITRAGNNVQLYFKKLEKRAYLVMDNYALNRLIVFEVLKQYFFGLIKNSEDEYTIKFNHYSEKYQSEIQSLKLVYDENKSGTVDDGEEDSTTGKVVMFR